MIARTILALAAGLAVVLPVVAEEPVQPAPEILAACREAVPTELLAGTDPAATSGRGAAGAWSVEAGEMDGAAPAEAVLVVQEAGKFAKMRFFALREGKVIDKKVSLKGKSPEPPEISFERFAEGRSLLHVDGREAGQVLLSWTGEKVRKVWEAGPPRGTEVFWFELEDLDRDGACEVITYQQQQVDVFRDEEFRDESGGGEDQTMSSSQVDARAVYRLRDGDWKKDKKLLESLR